jgi:hypothetical protein
MDELHNFGPLKSDDSSLVDATEWVREEEENFYVGLKNPMKPSVPVY